MADASCGCVHLCGDDGDIDGPGTCKGLPYPPAAPLVEIVVVDRRTAIDEANPDYARGLIFRG